MGSHIVGKRFSFDAAHHLPSLPDGHKCRRIHGHTYTVEVCVGAPQLSGPGFVTDLCDLSPFGDYIKTRLDHRDLNDVFEFEPTSELIAGHLAGWFTEHLQPHIPGRLRWLRVSETPSTWAQYTVDDAEGM